MNDTLRCDFMALPKQILPMQIPQAATRDIHGIKSSLSPCRRSLSQASAQDTHWPEWQHRDSASQPAVPHAAEHKPFGGQPTQVKPRCRKACAHHNKQRITTKSTHPDNVWMIRKALPNPGAQHAESTFSKRSPCTVAGSTLGLAWRFWVWE